MGGTRCRWERDETPNTGGAHFPGCKDGGLPTADGGLALYCSGISHCCCASSPARHCWREVSCAETAPLPSLARLGWAMIRNPDCDRLRARSLSDLNRKE